MPRVSTKPILQYTVRCSIAQMRYMQKVERSRVVKMEKKYVPKQFRGTELEKWYAVCTFTVAGAPNILEWYDKFDIELDTKTFIRAKTKTLK